MALGYCKLCDKLVTIRPGSPKWGSRERQWLPIFHDTPDGQPCAGDKRAL